jgi:hypothetical protein
MDNTESEAGDAGKVKSGVTLVVSATENVSAVALALRLNLVGAMPPGPTA